MALHLFPTIVVDTITEKTFYQSHITDLAGMKKYRRARRLLPGVWVTYRNVFVDYPGSYDSLGKRSKNSFSGQPGQ